MTLVTNLNNADNIVCNILVSILFIDIHCNKTIVIKQHMEIMALFVKIKQLLTNSFLYTRCP